MANIEDAEENRLLDLSLDGTFLSLIDSNGDEIPVPREAVAWTPAANGSKTFDADIEFDAPAADTSVAAYGIHTADTGGTRRWHRVLDAPQSLDAGVTYRVPAGAFTFALD